MAVPPSVAEFVPPVFDDAYWTVVEAGGPEKVAGAKGYRTVDETLQQIDEVLPPLTGEEYGKNGDSTPPDIDAPPSRVIKDPRTRTMGTLTLMALWSDIPPTDHQISFAQGEPKRQTRRSVR